MYIGLSPEQQKLQNELRAYFSELVTPELIDEVIGSEGGGPLYTEALEQMGRDGWLGIGWPVEYGGMGRTPIEQLIFTDEVQRAGFPLPFLTLNSVGPTIARYGTEAQKEKYIKKILQGKLHVSIGYTEPNAGTDLASLTCKAEREGEYYIINGQKVFTSLAGHADYIWLACRTNPEASKHRGISIFMVDTKLPGFQVQPTRTIGDMCTTSTFYENVRVHEDDLIGGEGNGWNLITGQLNHERLSLTSAGPHGRFYEEALAWARETHCVDGSRVIDQPWVASTLARVRAKLEVLRLMCWKQAWALSRDDLHFADASAVKVYGSEYAIDVYRSLMEIFGAQGAIKRKSKGSILDGIIEIYYRTSLILTFGGGTNEIQRDIIAAAGLGMPPSSR